MNYILFDGPFRDNLLPFTYTRPFADIRIGILTIREKWEMHLGSTTTTITEDYLFDKYPMVEMDENVLINASYLPNDALVTLVRNLEENQAIFKDDDVIAFFAKDTQEDIDFDTFETIEYEGEVIKVEHTWDIFSKNGEAIQEDFDLITRGRVSQPISATNNVLGEHNVFLEEGVTMEFATLNADLGPIYIGKDSEVMEGALIRGPFAMGEHSFVKMGARVYGPTTIGPYCTIGGEVRNAVFFAHSNKAHDGYLGDAAETRQPVMTIAPGQSGSSESYLFAGAKEWETIRQYEDAPGIEGFVDSIDWGWFFFLTKPIFRVLHWLNGIIGNMGWAIVGLTFLLKAIVFPLARKSYISMARMRELQPKMEEIKERLGDDRTKYQQEVMALYKREKVNPAAGCLPVLIQIPIFFSLYKVIFVTLELRHAPWLGWIRDLSAPDPSSILNLFGLLPYAGPARDSLFGILSLSAMAIILGISMWVQQRLNPAPTDPAQKMIFAWMPWVFMFMLGGFASGLVLYWITNNTITILQQYTIMSMHGNPPSLFGNIKDSVRLRKRK